MREPQRCRSWERGRPVNHLTCCFNLFNKSFPTFISHTPRRYRMDMDSNGRARMRLPTADLPPDCADHCESCSPWCSNTRRTARSGLPGSILSVKSSALASQRLNEWSLRETRGGSQLRIAWAVGSNSRASSSAVRPVRTSSTIWRRKAGGACLRGNGGRSRFRHSGYLLPKGSGVHEIGATPRVPGWTATPDIARRGSFCSFGRNGAFRGAYSGWGLAGDGLGERSGAIDTVAGEYFRAVAASAGVARRSGGTRDAFRGLEVRAANKSSCCSLMRFSISPRWQYTRS